MSNGRRFIDIIRVIIAFLNPFLQSLIIHIQMLIVVEALLARILKALLVSCVLHLDLRKRCQLLPISLRGTHNIRKTRLRKRRTDDLRWIDLACVVNGIKVDLGHLISLFGSFNLFLKFRIRRGNFGVDETIFRKLVC